MFSPSSVREPSCLHTRMRVLSLERTLGQHESVDQSMNACRGGVWKQITGSHGNAPNLQKQPHLSSQAATIQMAHRLCRSINQRGSNQPINKRCHRGFRSPRVHNPARALAAAAKVDAVLIWAPHYSIRRLPAGRHRALHQHTSTPSHQLAVRKCWWSKRRKQNKKNKRKTTPQHSSEQLWLI